MEVDKVVIMEVLKADVFQHPDALELQTLVAVLEAVLEIQAVLMLAPQVVQVLLS